MGKYFLDLEKIVKITRFYRHNDFPLAIRNLYNNDVTKFDFKSHLSGLPEFQDYNMDHTDLARMRKGHMGGQVSNLVIIRLRSPGFYDLVVYLLKL